MAVTTAAVIGGVAAASSAGIGIAGAAGAFTPDAPGQPNYGNLTRDAQQAEIDLLPTKFAGEEKYNPLYAGLNSRINYQNLFGTPGGKETRTLYRRVQKPNSGARWVMANSGATPSAAVMAEINRLNPANGWSDEAKAAYLGVRNVGADPEWIEEPYQETTDAPGTPGLLQIAEEAAPRMNALTADAQSYARRRGVQDVDDLGPDVMNTLRRYDPRSTAAADLLYDQTFAEAQKGSRLDPADIRNVEQTSRNRWSPSLGYSPEAAVQELGSIGAAGRSLQSFRQGALGNVVNQRSQLYGDPYRILGISDGRSTNPNQYMTAGQGVLAGSNATGAAASMYGQQYAANNAAQVAGYNSQMQGIGSIGQSLPQLATEFQSLYKPSPATPSVGYYSAGGGQPLWR